jgi:hypothetical protein
MALTQVFQTVPIPYRTPAQRLATGLEGGLLATYNPWLITPPRLYAEDLVSGLGCQAMWVTRVQLLDGYTVLNMLLWEDQIYWPSWGTVLQTFDDTSGAALATLDLTLSGISPPIWIAWTRGITAAFDGSLWRNQLNTDLTQIDPTPATFGNVLRGPFNSASYPGLSIGFGAATIVDPVNNILITSPYGAGNTIAIYNLVGTTSPNAQLSSFFLPGNAIAICPQTTVNNSTLFYVLTDNHTLCLCDYAAAKIVSSFVLPPQVFVGALKINIAWDPVRKLLLVFTQVNDNADGSSASITRGYYPVPNPERLTTPIALATPRQYQTTGVAVRLLGDLGAPIGGVNVTGSIVSATPAAGVAMAKPTAPTNANGYATMSITGALPCTADFQALATVDT